TPEWLRYSMHRNKRNNVQGAVLWDVEISLKRKLRQKISGDVVVNSNLPLFEKTIVPIQVVTKPAFLITPYMLIFDKGQSQQTRIVYIKSGEYQIESVYTLMEIKPPKECIKVNWSKEVSAKEIKLEIINEGCDFSSAKLEILLNHDAVSVIPIVFK
ncbi:MAG: hypothetical protein PHP01_07040, partial [Phycisphaerae bacterium]|nr:hypothetical protein [Phycisphaerae bacterium]